MDLRVLQNFLAVAREGNISTAAAALHLSQPTLSAQIRQMEEELGRPLLVRGARGSRGVKLTEEGRIVCQRAEEILALVSKMESEVALSDQEVRGEVAIGAGETGAWRLLARAAAHVQTRCPKIRYQIYNLGGDLVLDRLDRGAVDLGVICGHVDAQRYGVLPLPVRECLGVLVRRDDPLARRSSVVPQDLRSRPLLLPRQPGIRELLADWLQGEPGRIQGMATYDLVYHAALMVGEGAGVALCLGRPAPPEGDGLAFRPLDPPVEARTSLIWKKSRRRSKAAEKFLEAVRIAASAGE